MKETIFLQYYSRLNFGDDLFVRIFAEQFSDYRICLLGNPVYLPKNMSSNVRVSPFSWATVAIGVIQARIKRQFLKQKLQRLYDWCVSHAKKRCSCFRCYRWLDLYGCEEWSQRDPI